MAQIRITQNGKTRNYISYILESFEKGSLIVEMFAVGRSINKLVTIAEVVKMRSRFDLHQQLKISEQLVELNHHEDKTSEEDRSRNEVYKSVVIVTLSVVPMNIEDPGYQSPCERRGERSNPAIILKREGDLSNVL
jgi:DNA-binding protein